MRLTRLRLPSWITGTFLVGSLGLLLLLANQRVIPSFWRSWPLALVLVGCAVLMSDFQAFFVFGGLLVTVGVLVFLNNTDRLSFHTNWPLVLVAVANLVVIGHAMSRGSPPDA